MGIAFLFVQRSPGTSSQIERAAPASDGPSHEERLDELTALYRWYSDWSATAHAESPSARAELTLELSELSREIAEAAGASWLAPLARARPKELDASIGGNDVGERLARATTEAARRKRRAPRRTARRARGRTNRPRPRRAHRP